MIHDRGAKQRTVFESEEPITGVEFREDATTTLYLATTGRILTFTISGRGQGQPAKNLDDIGCGVGCMTIDRDTGDIIVARDDAIYVYGVNGRGPSYAYEGPKQLVNIFKSYIALATPPQTSISTTSATRAFSSLQAEDAFNLSSFTLLDTDLKYVAHMESLVSPVRDIFILWDDLILITLDGKVSDLEIRLST